MNTALGDEAQDRNASTVSPERGNRKCGDQLEISAAMRKHFHLRALASAFQLDGEGVK